MTKSRKKIWLVGVNDCESNSVVAICSTREIAEREVFKTRDKLLREYEEQDKRQKESIKEYCDKKKKPAWTDNIYKDMIKNLQGNDYKKWDNYPHDCPYIRETELLEEV